VEAIGEAGTSAQTVMRSTLKELVLDCQDVPGVSGFQAVNAQERWPSQSQGNSKSHMKLGGPFFRVLGGRVGGVDASGTNG
jgi:hypothetical protein